MNEEKVINEKETLSAKEIVEKVQIDPEQIKTIEDTIKETEKMDFDLEKLIDKVYDELSDEEKANGMIDKDALKEFFITGNLKSLEVAPLLKMLTKKLQESKALDILYLPEDNSSSIKRVHESDLDITINNVLYLIKDEFILESIKIDRDDVVSYRFYEVKADTVKTALAAANVNEKDIQNIIYLFFSLIDKLRIEFIDKYLKFAFKDANATYYKVSEFNNVYRTTIMHTRNDIKSMIGIASEKLAKNVKRYLAIEDYHTSVMKIIHDFSKLLLHMGLGQAAQHEAPNNKITSALYKNQYLSTYVAYSLISIFNSNMTKDNALYLITVLHSMDVQLRIAGMTMMLDKAEKELAGVSGNDITKVNKLNEEIKQYTAAIEELESTYNENTDGLIPYMLKIIDTIANNAEELIRSASSKK